MNAGQWSRLRQLFGELQSIPAGERSAFLDRNTAGDGELRAELERILAANDSSSEFLSGSSDVPRHGSVGPYQILEVLGEGGFGVVYLAEQTRPIRRRVALKLIKPGMDTKQVIARFEAERQALALMDHPAIAQVHEAGETEMGRPYFVMEYVPGLPITTFCDGERLPIPARLELFLQVCDAIHHAHQKGVIHRDIKPSNVVVTMRDGSAAPKVIDFGIAKATTSADTAGATSMTREGMIVGTLGYMSPEQASGSPGVDTRSDIYSLGALLYELLAGSPPFDAERLKQVPISDAVRVIREEDPPALTAQLTRSGEQRLAEIARWRSVDPRRLARDLQGELQWITLHALEKDPDRRYASAAELAADVRRYLTHQPVIAGAPSTMYRVRKLVRRHRVAVTAAALVLTAIVAGGIAAAIGFGRAVRAEHAARREAESARQVSDFLVELFQASNPVSSGGEKITAETLLEQGTRRIETGSIGDARIRARLLSTMGTAHLGLGLYDEGLRLLGDALAASESAQPPDEREVARFLRSKAYGFVQAGRPDSVSALLDRAISLHQRNGSPASDVADCLWVRGAFLGNAGNLHEADSTLGVAIAMAESELEPSAPLLLRLYQSKATVAHRRFELEDAERHYLRALELARQVGEPSSAVSTHRGLAWLYGSLGETEKALEHGEEGVRLARKTYPSDHPSVASALGGWAEALVKAGDLEQGISAREEAIRIFRAKNVQDRLAHELNSVGLIYRSEGEEDLAAARFEESHRIREELYGSENARTAETLANLARSYADMGMAVRADSCYRAALSVLDRVSPNSAFTAWATMGYANLCRSARRFADAESAYVHAEAMLDSTNAGLRTFRGECMMDRGYMRSIQGRHDEAVALIQAGYPLTFSEDSKDSTFMGAAHVMWANALAGAGDKAGAIEHLHFAAKCRVTPDLAKYPELVPLRTRPDYPVVASP